MPLVDIGGDGDDHVERIVNMIGLGQLVLDECRQIFPILNQLVVVAETGLACMLFKQRCIILHRFGALPQLLKRCERVASLIDRFESYVERSDKCRVIGKWRCEGLHSLNDAGNPVSGISLQERACCDYPQLVIYYPSRCCGSPSIHLHSGSLVGGSGLICC